MRRKERVRSPIWKWILAHYYPRHRLLDGPSFFESLVFNVTGHAPQNSLAHYLTEIANCDPLRDAYRNTLGDIPDRRITNPALTGFYYALIRETRPSCIVETGTSIGSNTALLLSALAANDMGEVISIDIPSRAGTLTMDSTLPLEAIGALIPAEFRGRWRYLAGDAKVLLPRVLIENDVDIFIHDSLHTRTHMSFEYSVARALMRPNTVIATDDAMWNSAWLEFVHTHRLVSLSCNRNPNLCATVNSFDAFEVSQGLGVQT